MTKESVIRYGRLYEIHRFHPKLKLRIMSEYTGKMPIYDASMNLRESPHILFMGICWVNDGIRKNAIMHHHGIEGLTPRKT